MSGRDDRISMRHMLDYAREALDMVKDVKRDDLDRDRKLQLSLTRLIEVAGEASSRVSSGTRDKYGTIPWRQIVGMRNRLIHGYDVLDLDVLWNTVTVEIPPLIVELEKALGVDR
jgi:uncharacterized protein with HEPN domain